MTLLSCDWGGVRGVQAAASSTIQISKDMILSFLFIVGGEQTVVA
jgi:hypothetical protein